jgi:hypothetical protein
MLGKRLSVSSTGICTTRNNKIKLVIVWKMHNSNNNIRNNKDDEGNEASDANLLWDCFTNWAATLEKVMHKRIT